MGGKNPLHIVLSLLRLPDLQAYSRTGMNQGHLKSSTAGTASFLQLSIFTAFWDQLRGTDSRIPSVKATE